MATIVIVVLLGVLSVVVFAVNIYCVVVIIYSKRLHKPSHMAICSLLLAHMLQGLFVIPSLAVKEAGTVDERKICDISRLSYFFTNYVSCLSLLLITFDRYFGVQFPLIHHTIITTRKMFYAITIVWIYSLLLNLIPFVPEDRESECNYNPQKPWTVFMLLGNTFVPFLIILYVYILIFKKARTVLIKRKLAQRTNVNDDGQVASRSQFNKSKITFLIVFFYIICWGPSFCYYLLQSLCAKCFSVSYRNSNVEDVVRIVMKLLTFIDGILAPLIYCCTNATFNTSRRRMFKKIRQTVLSKHTDEIGKKNAHRLNKHAQDDSSCTKRSNDADHLVLFQKLDQTPSTITSDASLQRKSMMKSEDDLLLDDRYNKTKTIDYVESKGESKLYDERKNLSI